MGTSWLIPPPSAFRSISSRPRSRLTKTAIVLPSGATARSTPPTGPVVSHCATMYSYSVLNPLVRFLKSLRSRVERTTTLASLSRLEIAAPRSPDGKARTETSTELPSSVSRTRSPKSMGSPVSVSSLMNRWRR